MNIVSYGRVSSVIDHRKCEAHDSCVYEVLVSWDKSIQDGGTNLQHGDDEFTWMPFTQIYKEVPQIVQEYFSLKKVSLEQILSDEVKKRMNNRGSRVPKNEPWKRQDPNKPEYIERSFDYLAKETMRITDKYQLQDKYDVAVRGDGEIRAKKKRNKRFQESQGLGPLDQGKSKSKSKKKFEKNHQNQNNVLNNFRRKDDRPGRLQKDMMAQKMLNQVSTFGKDVAQVDDQQPQNFQKNQDQKDTLSREQTRAKSSCSFDDIEFNLEKFQNKKSIASKQKLIRENDVIDHQMGSSAKKGDDDQQDYVANFHTKMDRPNNQSVKPIPVKKSVAPPNNQNWFKDLKKSNPVIEENKSEEPKVNSSKIQTIDLLSSGGSTIQKMSQESPKKATVSMPDIIMLDDSPEEKPANSEEKNQGLQVQAVEEPAEISNFVTQSQIPKQNLWLNQKRQQEQDYVVRNLDPLRLFQLQNQTQKVSQIEKLAEKEQSPPKSQVQNSQFLQLAEKSSEIKKSDFKLASIANKNQTNLVDSSTQNQGNSNEFQQEMFKIGFRPQTQEGPIDGKLDCPEDYPNLIKKIGNPWSNIPKMIHAMRICEKTGHIMYLCSWSQDYFQYFYTPAWVLSQLLMNSNDSKSDQQNYKLIAEFYHHFAEEMTLKKEGNK